MRKLRQLVRPLALIGALRLDGVVAGGTVDASTDTDVFGTFVHEALVPALRPGDVVAWDEFEAPERGGAILCREQPSHQGREKRRK